MIVNGKYQNGIKFEGTKGWIFCTRGGGGATASDPTSTRLQE
jgi:myo-inositol 2-dehydrogenase/D-chiro-inositol 1-dehydrogenase